MAFEVPSRAGFASFACVEESCLTGCHQSALEQGTFLLSVLTGCEAFPTEDPCKTMFNNAIFDMARWMVASLPFIPMAASAIQSETLGTYSYSRGFQNKLLTGMSSGRMNTGVLWFDLAIRECMCAGRSLVSSGGITVFERDNVYVETSTGRHWVLGPRETTPAGFSAISTGFSGASAPDGFQMISSDSA